MQVPRLAHWKTEYWVASKYLLVAAVQILIGYARIDLQPGIFIPPRLEDRAVESCSIFLPARECGAEPQRLRGQPSPDSSRGEYPLARSPVSGRDAQPQHSRA